MKLLISFTFLLVGAATTVLGQPALDIPTLLHSSNWVDRMEAYHLLAADRSRSAQANSELVALLLQEDEIVRSAFLGGEGASAKYGESYSEYTAYLAGTVIEIADQEPERADVWPALLKAPYDPESRGGRWRASHGDKTANFLLASARADDRYFRRADALMMLAEIVSYERDPSTKHRLTGADVETLDRTVRSGLDDPDEGVRYAAIKGLSLIGTNEDIGTLERIAFTDPRVTREGGATGSEIRFFNREAAREAADRLRKRLAAGSAAGPH